MQNQITALTTDIVDHHLNPFLYDDKLLSTNIERGGRSHFTSKDYQAMFMKARH